MNAIAIENRGLIYLESMSYTIVCHRSVLRAPTAGQFEMPNLERMNLFPNALQNLSSLDVKFLVKGGDLALVKVFVPTAVHVLPMNLLSGTAHDAALNAKADENALDAEGQDAGWWGDGEWARMHLCTWSSMPRG